MIAFPSQEKGNALYTLHNRIFSLMNISQSIFPDSGIESAKFITFSIHLWLILDWSLFSNNLTFSSDLECLDKFSIHLSFLSDLESAKFSIHLSFLLDLESFIKFSNHLAFMRPEGLSNSIHFSFLSDLESRPQIIIFSNHFAMKRNPGLDSIPLLIIMSSILSDNVIHAHFVG